MSSDHDKAVLAGTEIDMSVFKNELPKHIFKNKTILQAMDSNNGNYSGGYINISCRSLESSEKYLNFNEAYLSIPFVIAMRSTANLTANLVNGFSAGLKNGHYQLINTFSVQYRGSQLVEQQFNINQFANWKVLSTWSQDTLGKYGAVCGVCPDTEDSFTYSGGSSPDGVGFCNNRVAPISGPVATEWGNISAPSEINSGYLERLKTCPEIAGNSALGTIQSTTTAANTATNQFTNNGAATTSRVYFWKIMCIIRLKDICPLFDKMTLVKATDFYFQIGINNLQSLSVSVTGDLASPPEATFATPTVSVQGSTNPVMITSGNFKITERYPMSPRIARIGHIYYVCSFSRMHCC